MSDKGNSAVPYFSHIHISDYERAQIHPYVGSLCVTFMENVKPLLDKMGNKKRAHRELAARCFFLGALEFALIQNGGKVGRKLNDEIDEFSVSGALALFVGGTMVRGGFFNSVETYAQIWSKKNE